MWLVGKQTKKKKKKKLCLEGVWTNKWTKCTISQNQAKGPCACDPKRGRKKASDVVRISALLRTQTESLGAQHSTLNTLSTTYTTAHTSHREMSSVPDGGEGFLVDRVRPITKNTGLKTEGARCVVYWMSRDQRARDNWAMLYARSLAQRAKVPLVVVFSLVPRFLEATIRHYGFMLRGLHETAQHLQTEKQVPFHLLQGFAKQTVPEFATKHNAAAVVCDMAPLRVPLSWVKDVGTQLEGTGIPLLQVDAHNIVPVWVTSDKQEYAARTIRNKVHKHMDRFLQPFPELQANTKEAMTTHSTAMPALFDLDAQLAALEVNTTVKEVLMQTSTTHTKMHTHSAQHTHIHSATHSNSTTHSHPTHTCAYLFPWMGDSTVASGGLDHPWIRGRDASCTQLWTHQDEKV